MYNLTHLWLAMIGLTVLSLVVFVAISVWSWHGNVIMVKRYGEHLRYAWSRLCEHWRRWREPDYRAYQKLIERYRGPMVLLSSLGHREELFFKMEKLAVTDQERDQCQRERERCRQARIKCAPRVGEQLAAFTDDELATVAESLIGFDFDLRPSSDSEYKAVNETIKLLRQLHRCLRAEPRNALSHIRYLEKFLEQIHKE